MPVPVIDPITSLLAFTQGLKVNFQPSATESPTSWACTNLPPGLAINTTSGLISGVPSQPFLGKSALTATNGSGTSTAVTLDIAVVANDKYDTVAAVDIDVDVETKMPFNQAITNGTPPVFAARGDKLMISVGIRKKGVLQDLQFNFIKAYLKEFDDEGEDYALNDGTVEKMGSGAQTRYLIMLDFTGDQFAKLLAEYEKSEGTSAFPLMQFEFHQQEIPPGESVAGNLPWSSRVFYLWLQRDLDA